MGKIADAIRGFALPQQKQTQLLALDREFMEMESQIEALKTENLKLRAKVNPLEREVERLKDQVQQSKAKSSRLDEVPEKLLTALANSESDITQEMLIAHFQLSKGKGDHYFDILAEKNFAHLGSVEADGHYWRITPEGRAYLAKHNLL